MGKGGQESDGVRRGLVTPLERVLMVIVWLAFIAAAAAVAAGGASPRAGDPGPGLGTAPRAASTSGGTRPGTARRDATLTRLAPALQGRPPATRSACTSSTACATPASPPRRPLKSRTATVELKGAS